MDKEKLKELCEMSTPGPWHVGGKDQTIVYAGDGYATASCAVYHGRFRDVETAANSAFIANAREAVPALLAEIEELKRARDKLINKLNTDSQNFEIECLKARAEAAESREKDLAAKLEIVSVAASALAFCAETSGGTAGRDEDLCRTIEGVKSILSLPLPGSAQRRDEEVRREAFEEAISIVEGTAVPKPFSAKRDARKPPKPSLTRIEIVNELRAACEKGGENG